MANNEHLASLKQGVDAWNEWRKQNRDIGPDLFGAILSGAILSKADLRGASLSEANLRGASLVEAILSGAILSKADLRGASLSEANLREANLREANLSGANFREANLIGVNLSGADLSDADLRGASLIGAHLIGAHLIGANLGGVNLSGADLSDADLRGASLSEANLSGSIISEADLRWAILIGADLSGADLSGANLGGETVLANIDLSNTKGLEACRHSGPCVIDIRTLQRSGPLPLAFLRGIGLPDNLIDYLPSLVNQAIQFYSCFISYSSKDDDFTGRLHADLQAKGVRCYFSPEDLKIGAKTWDDIDQAIRHHDKVLLVLSRASIASEWVEDEVNKAYAEERSRKQTVLFPVRLDNAVMETSEPWATKLRDTRNIGDFTRWKDHDAYQKGFERLLRDLKPELERRPEQESPAGTSRRHAG